MMSAAKILRFYAISGSLRARSKNLALLKAIQRIAPPTVSIEICDLIGLLPIFNPDHEGDLTPAAVLEFALKVDKADGLIVSSPEYAHGVPGGIKNALDWLVSRFEIPGKPVMLVHASHRGDDALNALAEVLRTISADLRDEAFARVPLLGTSDGETDAILSSEETKRTLQAALTRFIEGLPAGRR